MARDMAGRAFKDSRRYSTEGSMGRVSGGCSDPKP